MQNLDNSKTREVAVHTANPSTQPKGTLPEKLVPARLAQWRGNRVKVCGRWVYNPPPEFTMPRSGWAQFSTMTSCSLWDAISVCSSWEEFFDLNILTLNGYFPHWSSPYEQASI